LELAELTLQELERGATVDVHLYVVELHQQSNHQESGFQLATMLNPGGGHAFLLLNTTHTSDYNSLS
jgi:hypothetical protein